MLLSLALFPSNYEARHISHLTWDIVT